MNPVHTACPLFLQSILILSHLCLNLSISSVQVFFTKILYAFSHPCLLHALPSHLCNHPTNIWWRIQIMKLLIMHFFFQPPDILSLCFKATYKIYNTIISPIL
jgi:hypothetical protein